MIVDPENPADVARALQMLDSRTRSLLWGQVILVALVFFLALLV